MSLPNVKKPCKDCPFRKDSLKGWLGKERMTDILASKSFVCHKKTHLQCAGHMLINKHENEFYSLAISLGMQSKLGLSGQELVFETKEECVKHHT